MSGALLPGIGKHAESVKVKTAGYFPPDSPHGDPGTDTDVYALGVVLYEMLTRYAVSKGKLPPIEELRDGISAETKNILNKGALFGRLFRLHTAWEMRIELDEAIRSFKKREAYQEKEHNRLFSSMGILFHDLWTRTMKPMAPLIMLFLTLGLPIVPLLTGYLLGGKPYSSIIDPLLLIYFCPLSFFIYLIWVRFMAHAGPVGKIYRFFHKRRHFIASVRIISLLAIANYLIILSLYVNIVINILSLTGRL